jgi:tetratricopeptide (TPR) repeat protein
VRLRLLESVATWPAPPAVPEAAHDHIVRSQLILQHNGSPAEAEAELRQVTELAPWWADGYFNLGLVQGSSGNYNQAVDTLKLFVEGAPDNPRVQQARDKIIEFQFDQEQRDAMAALAGRWVNAANGNDTYTVSVDGDHLSIVGAGGGLTVTAVVKDRELNGTIDGASYAGEHGCTIPPQSHPVSGHISADGRSIDLQYVWSSFATNYQCATMFNEVVACGGMAITHDVCTAVTLNGSNSVTLVLQRQ